MLGRLALSAILLASAATTAHPFDQLEVGPGHLPPILKTYKDVILSWSRSFYADPAASMQGALASDPVLIRDGTGRLFWLVCLETPNAPPSPRLPGPERHAFGFSPAMISMPQGRSISALTRDDCDTRTLAYRPFQEARRATRR